ncbi:MAG: ATP-binding cassette domain-containing protein, partial [Betaproteobacteria bacterium]|nr:ATP-binding cassette domain-containing protein [Betaproteobacteria bacterium]
MKPATPILSVKNVEASYGPVQAIRGVSLQVPQGSIVTVLGSNGAGKTTILKTISGILDPRKGTIDFAGQAIAGL